MVVVVVDVGGSCASCASVEPIGDSVRPAAPKRVGTEVVVILGLVGWLCVL